MALQHLCGEVLDSREWDSTWQSEVMRVDYYFDDVARDVLAETQEVYNNVRPPAECRRKTINTERLPLDKLPPIVAEKLAALGANRVLRRQG
jgi:hypothetical protein